MKYSEAKYGRVFVIRLEDGDPVQQTLEQFAREHGIRAAAVLILGGVDAGSAIVVGPEQDRVQPVTPVQHVLDRMHEIAGVGTIFPNTDGRPVLHCHIACGRQTTAVVGHARSETKTWHVLEVILLELLDTTATRVLEPAIGFELLHP